MSKVNDKYQEALFFFEKLESASFNKNEYQFYLSAFINASRNISYAIQKESKHKDDFSTWWNKKRKQMKEDKVMIFFYALRNYSLKEADNKISGNTGFQMRHLLEFNKSYVKVTILDHCGNKTGEEIILENCKGVNITSNPELFERMYFFDKIEKIELNLINFVSVTELCYYYLGKLSIIVKEYEEKFN